MTSVEDRKVSRTERRLLAGPPSSARGPKSWLYALVTINPPPGEPDFATRWIVVTRAAVLPMTLFAGLVAGLLAVNDRHFSWVDWVLATVGIMLAHLNNNLTNDLFDSTEGLDTEHYPRALYAPHPTQTGLVTTKQLYTAIGVSTGLAVVVAVALLVERGWGVIAFAVAGAFLSIAYTAPPLRLKKRGLGEPDVFVTWGPLMVAGTFYAATGHLPWQIWLASVPYGLLCTTVLMGKHIDKIPFDEPTNTRTLPVMLGEARARVATVGLLYAFYLFVIVAVAVQAMPWTALLVLLAVPRMLKCARALRQPRPAEPPKNFPVWPLWFAAIMFVHIRLAGSLLVLSLVISAVFHIEAY